MSSPTTTTTSPSSSTTNTWLLSLPLKHREIGQQKAEVIAQDRQIIFTYLKDKLVTAGDVCKLSPIDLPEFKVSQRREGRNEL